MENEVSYLGLVANADKLLRARTLEALQREYECDRVIVDHAHYSGSDACSGAVLAISASPQIDPTTKMLNEITRLRAQNVESCARTDAWKDYVIQREQFLGKAVASYTYTIAELHAKIARLEADLTTAKADNKDAKFLGQALTSMGIALNSIAHVPEASSQISRAIGNYDNSSAKMGLPLHDRY